MQKMIKDLSNCICVSKKIKLSTQQESFLVIEA
jgi:hypothetical protein